MAAEPMQYEFCTLFDRNYLIKGLALYASLRQHAGCFRLWILCMDDDVVDTLRAMSLDHVELVPLADFEDENLRAVRPTRSRGEYCWTCTPSLPLYVLSLDPEIEMITYLDADLFFFSHPEAMFEELADGSIGIIEHRYAPVLGNMAELYGTYNVECVAFRNDAAGRSALEWWRSRCIEWCFGRVDDQKYADQKYLDDWPQRFSGVRVLEHKGLGLAPWNIGQYTISSQSDGIRVDGVPLVFYHFHQFSLFEDGRGYRAAGDIYPMKRGQQRIVYDPYSKMLRRMLATVRSVHPGWSYGLERRTPRTRVRDGLRFVIPIARRVRRAIRSWV